MNIILPIKQVPETKSVRMDEESGTVKREGVESIINPLDLYAIELGLILKDKYEAELTALSMGPPKAGEALREAVAMGVDSAVLLSDKLFAGSDTWSTSLILSEAVKKLGRYDLIICGERATDGDTGQVGPGIASFLDIPVISYVNEFLNYDNKKCKVRRLIENGVEELEAELPSLLTVVKEVAVPRLPTLNGKKRAKKIEIPILKSKDLNIDESKIGLKGSPTEVSRIFRPKVARNCRTVTVSNEKSLENAALEMINEIKTLASHKGYLKFAKRMVTNYFS